MSHAYGLPPKRVRLARSKPKCPACGGWDMGAVGFIHHAADCPRAPCSICGKEIWAGQKRTIHAGRTAHLDCSIDYMEHLDEEHSRG
jgi:hypothetical protein